MSESDEVASLPGCVPARRVNEFVYCPRLFHLEWVQSQFTSNDDVEEGLYVHRVVDVDSGDLPEPTSEHLAGRSSRSYWLESQSIGVSAKIDIVEVDAAGAVVPVDYKKGGPARNGKSHDTDRIQSVLQAMLLQEAGYNVPHAEVWYAETRQRVVIDVNARSIEWVERVLDDMRRVAADPVPPPPLVNSPKCPRCSLVGICLPDEVNAERSRGVAVQAHKVRLMARDPDSRPVYVQEQGAVVGVGRGRLEVRKNCELLADFRLIDVSQLCLLGNITVTPQAMRELFRREIPTAWFSYGGWFTGMAEGLPGKNVDLRRAQFTATTKERLSIATQMIEAKIRNTRTLLRRNAKESAARVVEQLADMAQRAKNVETSASLLGIEGVAARLYFGSFKTMFSSDARLDVSGFAENGRARRPPPDPVNYVLSFLYSMLVRELTVRAAMIGFDPYEGVYHASRFGRPALALDLAEEFRPLIADGTTLTLINNGELRDSDFVRRAGGCQLTKEGRRIVIAAFERRMSHEIRHPVYGYVVNYRRALDVQARMLAAHLLGQTSVYTPFTTR